MATSQRCKVLFVAAAVLMTSSFASASTASPALGFSSINAMQPLSFRNDGSECPPCFNCLLPAFSCGQYAECSAYDGTCKCPPGWAGIDCLEPLCGSPARGNDRPMRGDAPACECDDGWTGINCNVCTDNRACDALLGTDDGGVCYQMGDVVKSNYQMCDVTNKQILSILDGKIPEVTFSCDRNSSECNFQFWVDQRESFFCQLHECESDAQFDDNSNNTQYRCQTVSCSCIADRMLCGENGSIDLTDYLKEEIKGPASFECAQENRGTNKCVFDEPNMNDLISSVFGDPSIFLTCRAGECLYNTEVPGYKRPVSRINTPLIAAVIAACSLFLVAVILLTWYLSRRRFRYEPVVPFDDSDDESIKLMADHKPASLYFENVSYTLNGKTLLESVQGLARPGEVMAIMGASGAGKTTFLDILARKNKRGEVSGNFYVNGEKVSDHDFRNVVGFVDQEDTMLPTLTVHETILNSALLRLPRDMTRAAKEQRVYDVEKQLGIHAIRDSLIGSEEGRGRGISGGEKRRVGIACELVTSPSILFLDEPTSGLDAYNAYNVVDCLVTLARIYKRTVIFTIHQPRSNITALFDRLVLLAQGRTVYSGPFAQCQAYFDHLGYSCPPGFNIADYLVDLTMHAGSFAPYAEEQEGGEEEEEDGDDDNGNLGVPGIVGSDGASDRPSSTRAVKSIASISAASTTADEGGSGGGGGGAHAHSAEASSSSLSPLRPRGKRRDSVRARQERELFTRRKNTLDTTASSDAGDGEPGAYRLRNQPHSAESPHIVEDPDDLPPITIVGNDLDIIINAFTQSDIAKSTHDEIRHAVFEADAANGHFAGAGVDGVGANGGGGGGGGGGEGNGYAPEGPNIHLSIVGKGYARVGYFRQFVIISQRTWKNLYRNPMLMLTHYAISILLGVLSGFLFYGLTNDIAGFQNRLGLFFFVLALFGFSTLTSLSVFSSERLLFVRERANGYYSPLTYFASKVLFDILPLRILPPLLMGSIIYPMTGLVPDLEHFLVFLLVLVLFNLAASGICLFIGIVCKDGGVANLIGSLVMLFSLLFAGLLLNHDKIPPTAAWLQYLSIFHYAFEALIVNEVRLLTLIDQKYKLDITVPGSVILSSFGFDNLALWRDVVSLGVFALVFIVLAYGAMHILLVEKR